MGTLWGQQCGAAPRAALARAAASASSRALPALLRLMEPKETALNQLLSPHGTCPGEAVTRRTLAWHAAIAHPSCPRATSASQRTGRRLRPCWGWGRSVRCGSARPWSTRTRPGVTQRTEAVWSELSKLPGTVFSPGTHLGAAHTPLPGIFSGELSISLTVKHFYSTLITGFIFSPFRLQQQLLSCSAKLWSAGSMTRAAHCCDGRQTPQVFYKLSSLLLH